MKTVLFDHPGTTSLSGSARWVAVWTIVVVLGGCQGPVCGPGTVPIRDDGGLASVCPGESLAESPPAAFTGRLGRTVTQVSTSVATPTELFCGDVPNRFFDLRRLTPSNQRHDVIAFDYRCDNLDHPCTQSSRLVATHETRYRIVSHIQPDLRCATSVDEDNDGRVDENCGLCLVQTERVGQFMAPLPIVAAPSVCMEDIIVECLRAQGLERWQQYSQDDLGPPPGSWNAAIDCMDESMQRIFDYEAPEVDGDRVCDQVDNCPNAPNPDQLDFDQDRSGDLCDPDDDNDGVEDDAELAHGLNPFNDDTDGDTLTDHHEGAHLGTDTDADSLVDALDDDSDEDGWSDQEEAGDDDLGTAPVDTDGDGTPNFQDDDSDQDGVGDLADNCRLVENTDQGNADGALDGGDACDEDDDDDGLLDEADNCPLATNPLQQDFDADGLGDACDVTISILEPSMDVTDEPSIENQRRLTSSPNANSATFLAAEVVGGNFDPATDEVVWTLDESVGASLEWSPARATPFGGIPAGTGTEPSLLVSGMPPSASAFGERIASAYALVDGIVSGEDHRVLRFFWPTTVNTVDGPWAVLTDADFARNHPGADLTVLVQHELRQLTFNDVSYALHAARAPNWLFYWVSFDANPFFSELTAIQPRYAVFRPTDSNAAPALDDAIYALFPPSAFFFESIGLPNNVVYFGDLVVALVEQDSPVHVEGVRGFYLNVVHEECHLRQFRRWSTANRRQHLEPADPNRRFVDSGMPIHPMDWSWGVPALEEGSATFHDLDSNGAFSPNLECDVDGDGILGITSEAQVLPGRPCGGQPIIERDFDGDGQWNTLVDETDVENLDSDADNLPNREDALVDTTVETECNLAESDEYSDCLVDPTCRLAFVRDSDWGSPGENFQ